MTDDILDLIGGGDEPDEMAEALARGEMPSASAFVRPVGITFLAAIFDTQPRYIERKLAPCPVVGYSTPRGGRKKPAPLYDLKVALSYLVEPKIDIATWIKGQNAASLPNHINKTFWEGMNAKLRHDREAKELWHTQDVLDVLGRVAMTIKEESLLWVENLPGKDELTTQQYHALMKAVTELLDNIHSRLSQLPAEHQTTSYKETVEGMLDNAIETGDE